MSEAPLVIDVHYDFASSLCYVAHGVMRRMAGTLEELAVALRWTPVDLSILCGYRRGAPMPGPRREEVRLVGEELGVPVRVPARWLDSREAGAAAIACETSGREETWRERIFCAFFEEGRYDLDAGAVARLLADLDLRPGEGALAHGRRELSRRTLAAAERQVSGVPTFMLGEWPMGGIQEDATMAQLLGRWARRARSEPSP